MNSFDPPVWLELLFSSGVIGAASVVVCAVGLAAGWLMARHRPALRHGILLATVILIALLPLLAVTSVTFQFGREINGLWDFTSTESLDPAGIDHSKSASRLTTTQVAETLAYYEAADGVPLGSGEGSESTRGREWIRDGTGLHNRGPLMGVVTLMVPLIGLWIAGTLLALMRVGWGFRRISRLKRSLVSIEDPRIATLGDAARETVGVRSNVPVLASEEIETPVTIGLLRPIIVLPRTLARDSEQDALRGVLLHEFAHVARRDLRIGLTQRIVASLFWWNPLLHLVNRRLGDVREELCDAVAASHLKSRRCYAELLLALASQSIQRPPIAALGLLPWRQPVLTRRIHNLLTEDPPMSTTLKRSSRAALLLIVVAVSVAVGANWPRIRALTEAAQPTAGAEFRDEFAAVARMTNMSASQVPLVLVAESEPADQLTEESAAAESAAGSHFPGESAPSFDVAAEESPESSPAPDFLDNLPQPSLVSEPPVIPELGNVPQVRDEPNSILPNPYTPARPDDWIAPDPNRQLPAIGTPNAPVPAGKQIALISLTSHPDGTLKQLYYLTEPLGNDDQAFDKLQQHITDWATAAKKKTPQVELELEVAADPALRYEHIVRSIETCSALVSQIKFAMTPPTIDLVMTIGFVRNSAGERIADTPVLIIKDRVLPVDMVLQHFENMMRSMGLTQRPVAEMAISVRADRDVDVKVIQTIISEAQRIGIQKFSLSVIGAPAAGELNGLRGEVTAVNELDNLVTVSIGADDGVRPGQRLSVAYAPESTGLATAIAEVEVVTVELDHAVCRVIAEDVAKQIDVGAGVRNSANENK